MLKLNKTKIIIFSCLVFVGLFINFQPAKAIFDVPFAIINTQLDALDFIDTTLLKYMVALSFSLIIGTVSLVVSGQLLEWTSSYPVNVGNELVVAGWQYTSGLVNILFILIFIVIALSYILKIDTFKMQQTLPRLIIMALLLNFSLLFVKMIVDIGWILQNSLREVFFADGFITKAIQPLADNSALLLKFLLTNLFLFMASAVVPGLNVVKTVAIGALFFINNGWKPLIQAIVSTLYSISVALIFFVYSILFLCRISIIWLLAILAPFAFLANILPTTQKYFSQWLKALIQWVFLGSIMFFFLGLGISLFRIMPGAAFSVGLEEAGGFTHLAELTKYLFLIIYLGATLYMLKKLAPIGAQTVWSLGEMAMKKGGISATKEARLRRDQLAAKWERGTKETAEKVRTRIGRGPTFGEKLRMGPGAWGNKGPEQMRRIIEKAEIKEKALREGIAKKDPRGEDKKIASTLDKVASAIDTLSKQKGFDADVAQDLIKKKLDVGVLAARPDLAPTLGKTVADAMNKTNKRDADALGKTMRPEAAKNVDVVKEILGNSMILDSFAKNATIEVKEEIVKTIIDPKNTVFEEPELQNRFYKMTDDSKWPIKSKSKPKPEKPDPYKETLDY